MPNCKSNGQTPISCSTPPYVTGEFSVPGLDFMRSVVMVAVGDVTRGYIQMCLSGI